MQIVAIKMSDMGSSDLSPASGMSAKFEPDSSSPVITSRKSANASIRRSLNHPSEAMR